MKGKKLYLVRGCFILALAAAILSKVYSPKEAYIKSIQDDWGVYLPLAEWEAYNGDTKSSFQGDGVRYHVFRYQEEDEIQKAVSWHRGKNPLVEQKIDALLRDLEIGEEFKVNFDREYQYFTLMNRGSSTELFLLYFPEQKRLSVVEDYI